MATNISFPTYGFVNEILALSEDNWRTFFKPFITDSVQSGLATIAGANMTVYVSAGECRCGAVMGILDEMIALDIANGDSTYDRIDSVIVQYTYGEPSTLAIAIVQGTPSANPVPPTLTKVYDTLWQMEIAQILVPSGATSSSEFTITDKRVIYESIESIIDDNTESEERVWSSQKTREEIVSLSTEIYDSLNTKADVITRTVSGDIVTITDGGDNLPVKELVVDIEPVQDLHGQPNPYPAGGGKNLIPDGTDTTNGYVSGKYPNSYGSLINNESYYTSEYFPVSPSTEYTFSTSGSTLNAPAVCFYDSSKNFISGTQFSGHQSRLITSPENAAYARCPQSTNLSTRIIQFELGSTATTPTPYSNICPISGHSTATVTRTGKNILPPTIYNYAVSNNKIVQDANYRSMYCKVISGKTYTVSRNTISGNRFRLVGTSDEPANGVSSTTFISADTTGTLSETITIPDGYNYLLIYLSNQGDTITSNIQVEFGSTATSFEPYQPIQTVTIDLDGTIYGGTLNVLTGTMTVTHELIEIDENSGFSFYNHGTNTNMQPWFSMRKAITSVLSPNYSNGLFSHGVFGNPTGVYNKAYISTNNYVTFVQTSDTEFTTADQANAYLSAQKTAGTSLQIYASLATPLTVQLTPEQLTTLLGTNHIWANTGNVLDLTYRADSKSFIDEQIAESQIKTRQMITIVTDQMIAPSNLTINDIIVVNDELYKVVNSNIASGEAMVVGTNVIKITLAEYIQSLL